MPKRAASATRREEIIKAAIRCLARKGYAGVTLRTLASEAGLNQGLLHYHFRTDAVTAKRAILRAALEAVLAKLEGLRPNEKTAGDAQAELRGLIQRLLELDHDTRLALLQFLSAIRQDRDIGRMTADAYHNLRKAIEGIIVRGIARHLSCDVNPGESSFIILGLVEGVALQRTLDPGAMNSAQACQICLNVITGYLARPARVRARSAVSANPRKRGTPDPGTAGKIGDTRPPTRLIPRKSSRQSAFREEAQDF